ncbi:MAG: ERF family protein [Methylocella sp.]
MNEQSAGRQIAAIDDRRGAVVSAPVSDGDSLLAVISKAARDPSVNVDKMERLMAMYERVEAARAKTAYSAALSAMQPDLPIIEERGKITIHKKDKPGEIQQETPYARWDDINQAIRPVLGKHGFAISFRTGLASDGKITVTGILSHAGGHQEETTMTLPHDSTGSKNAVQAVGSSTSYGKRYVAMALLNLSSTRSEDDDGRAGGGMVFLSKDQITEIDALIDRAKIVNRVKLLKFLKAESFEQIPAGRFDEIIRVINDTLADANRKARGE